VIASRWRSPPENRVPPRADHGVVPLGQPGDQVVDARGAGRGLDLLVGGIRSGESQVVADRLVEQVRLLRHEPDGLGQRGQPQVAHVVELGDQVGQRRLARARLADESGRRAGRYVQVDVEQRPGTVAVVTEADTDETHIATHGRQRSGVAALGDVDRQVQHREDPPEQRHRGGCRDADAPATPWPGRAAG